MTVNLPVQAGTAPFSLQVIAQWRRGEDVFIKSYTLTWWQFGLLKTAMIAFGLAVGASWPAVFGGWTPALWVIFIVPGICLMFVAFKQV